MQGTRGRYALPMSPIARVLLKPRVNLTIAGVSALGEVISWFTTVDDAYRVTPVLFMLTVTFIVFFAVNEHLGAEKLREDAQPKLRLVWEPQGQMYDSLHLGGDLRIFRVGVVNSGAAVHEVSVKVARIHPEHPRIFPMRELQQTHEEDGTSRFTVNKSDEPLVFVDVIWQRLHERAGQSSVRIGGIHYAEAYRKGQMSSLNIAFADGHQSLSRDDVPHPERYGHQYLIWLVIDGPGAETSLKIALRRNNASGQYDLTIPMFGASQ
jgi:prepilin-type processing-associated H-X9-DG protein